MDIEGSEEAALKGAIKTIKKQEIKFSRNTKSVIWHKMRKELIKVNNYINEILEGSLSLYISLLKKKGPSIT